jgi:glycosyltransferase involved in cell wall biosynthesis
VDLLHVHGRSTFSFAATVKTLGLNRIPILLHDHYGQIEIDRSVPLWFKLWGRHFVERYVGVYAKLADWAVAAGVPRPKCGAIGNALDLTRVRQAVPVDFKKEFGVAEGERVGLVVAGIRPEKGTAVLLEAIAKLSGGHAVKIVLVGGERGGDYVKQCRAKCFSLGLDGTVIFAGERGDVPNLIKGADFAIAPSLSESGPLVLIEFMAGGLPFVATRVGDISDRAEKAGATEFVPPNDAGALAAGLDRLLQLTPPAWQQRREIGQKIAATQFEMGQTMPRWYRMYRECLKVSTL